MRFALAFGDSLICGPDLMREPNVSGVAIPERRRRSRVSLALDVHLFPIGEVDPIEGQTKNLSSEGFYCVVSQPIPVGEIVAYLLLVPTFGAGGQHELVQLVGQIEVLRLEQLGATFYGMGCRIRDYRVLGHDAMG
jgi:hypothetical protein